MSILGKVALGIGMFFIIMFVSCAAVFISSNNDFVRQEASVTAQWTQNKNNYDNYFKKLKEACQVPDMYRDDLKKVYDGAMTGRYGKKGSQAVFQFIKEHNPNFNEKLYVQIQRIIESGRNNFENEQKMLIDKKRVYEVSLKSFPSSIIAGLLGFPKIDLSKYEIITSDVTEEAFKTKKSEPIKLR